MLWVLTGLSLDNLEKYSLKTNPPRQHSETFRQAISLRLLLSRFTARHFPSTARFARVIAVEDPILGKGLTVDGLGPELNNEVFAFYQGSSQFPIQREYYKPTYTFWTSVGTGTREMK